MPFLRSAFGIEIVVNAVLPWVVYTLAEPGIGRVHALMASAIPPIAWSAIQFVRQRRIDPLSILVLSGIALSLLAFFGGGSFRMLELREQLVNGLLGVVFLGSVAIKRPLLAVLVQSAVKEKSPAEIEKFQSRFDSRRRLIARFTLVFGFLLLIQTAVAIFLVFTLSIPAFLVASPVLSYTTLGLLVAVALYMKRQVVTASAQAEHGGHE